ncbi:MAG: hypothetical protein NVV72_10195 [Asticcacaulis sp.]|nr:hypothetical protein [Asticcacaulis sp.]
MVQTTPQSPMRKYGIVIVLAVIVLLVAIVGVGRILSHDPKPVQGVDRSAHRIRRQRLTIRPGGCD